MQQALNIGIIGYGYASRTFHAPLISSVPGLHLSAIVSRDTHKVQHDWPGVTVYADTATLCARPDIDIVVIPTPNETHYPLASLALAAGKHVVVDKPFTLTLDEARALHDQSEKAGVVLSVFHNRRWDADFITLRALIASGELGRIVQFESRFDRYRPEVRARWREQGGPGSGLWYDLGPHLLDQALTLFGMPNAMSLDLVEQRNQAQANDYFHARLHYGAMRVLLSASTLALEPGARFTVYGTQGSVVKHGLDTQENWLKAGLRPPMPDWGRDECPANLTLWRNEHTLQHPLHMLPGNYPAYYSALRDAVHGTGVNPVPPEDAIQVMALIELGARSACELRTLNLDSSVDR